MRCGEQLGLRARELRLGGVDVDLRSQRGCCPHLRFVDLLLALSGCFLIHGDQLSGREQREVALGGLKDQVKLDEFELSAGGVGLGAAFGYLAPDAAEIE